METFSFGDQISRADYEELAGCTTAKKSKINDKYKMGEI